MRPIAAFSMEDYEKLTRNAYQAAEFKRGKDKKKRKKRGALATAGMVAGGVAGTGLLGAAGRYGYAEATKGKKIEALKGKQEAMGTGLMQNRNKDMVRETQGDIKAVSKERQGLSKMGGGAKAALASDIKRVRSGFGSAKSKAGAALAGVRGYDYKSAPGKAFNAVKNAKYGELAGKAGKMASLRGQQALALGTSAPGLAVLGAAGLGAAGYGAYRMMNKKKKK